MAGRRALRTLLLLAPAFVLAGAGVTAAARTVDADTFKPWIIGAVRRATGRELALDGTLRLQLALRPTLVADDVSFANAADGSRPQMARIARVEAQFGLLPLLWGQVEIDRLLLVRPDLLLETDASGRPNWVFPKPPPGPSPPSVPPAAPALRFDLRKLRMQDGVVTLQDGRTGQTLAITGVSFRADAPSAAPLTFDLHGDAGQTPLALAGIAGPPGQGGGTPWPVSLTLTALGAAAHATGTIADPASLSGYDLRVAAAVPDLAVLAPLLPGVTLPHVEDVRISAHIADTGNVLPLVTDLRATAMDADLSAYAPDLLLSRLLVDAPAFDKPVHADVAGSDAGTNFTAEADGGPPADLLANGVADAPYPITAAADAAGAHLIVSGSIAHLVSFRGVDLAIDATIPDLAALSPVLHLPLPPLHDIAAQLRLGDAGTGLGHIVTVHSAHVVMPQADLTGDLTFAFTARPSVRGTLAANRVDVDALRDAWRQTAQSETASSPATPASPAMTFMDRPLPVELLRKDDLDLQLLAGSLQTGGETWRNVRGHVILNYAKLTLNPIAADLPSGQLVGNAQIDARQPVPAVTLVLREPGVPAAPLIDGVTGQLEVAADLHGTGATPRALAATASGQLGLAVTDGTFRTSLLDRYLAPLMRAAGLPDVAIPAERGELRCAAVSMTLASGVGIVRAMGLDTSLFTMGGSGIVNLANDTVDMRVHPAATLPGGLGGSLTLHVTGPITAPTVTATAPGAAADAGRASPALPAPVGVALGPLGAGPPTCAQALADVRAPAEPVAVVAPPSRAQAAPPSGKPANTPRRLYR